MKGVYSARISSTARSSSAPTTMRSGRMKSSTAAPSFRNSGLRDDREGERRTPRAASASRTAVAHLVGRAHRHRALVDDHLVVGHVLADVARPPPARTAGRPSRLRRAACPRAMNWIVPCATAAVDVGGELQPARGRVALHDLLQPGLVDRDAARLAACAILRSSTSRQTTWLPISARQAPGDQADITGADDSDFHGRGWTSSRQGAGTGPPGAQAAILAATRDAAASCAAAKRGKMLGRGHARDYVQMLWPMLQQQQPEGFAITSVPCLCRCRRRSGHCWQAARRRARSPVPGPHRPSAPKQALRRTCPCTRSWPRRAGP